MNNIEDQTLEALASVARHPQAIGQLPNYLQQQIVEDPIGTLARLMEPAGRYTQLISGTEILTLDPTDGTAFIANAKDVFKVGIDGGFVNLRCNVPSASTPQQNVLVHEMTQGGTFDQIFHSLNSNLDNLCLTQAQVIQFVQKHKKWLHREYATFFLFKVGTKFFVANVDVYSDGELNVYLYRFSDDHVWYAKYRHRIVFPQTLVN